MGKNLDALKIPFYQAHSSNYTKGRNRPIRYITIHHIAGTPSTLRYLWQDPLRNASSTFAVFPGKIEQYVKIGDTPWTNGNFASNSECIPIEVYGDWRNGRTYPVLGELKKLIRAIRKDIAIQGQNYHQDVSLKFTECPAQLRAHAKRVFNEVTAELNSPAPAPKPPASKITYKAITKKTVLLKWAANLWNFNFTAWDKAKSVQGYPKGHAIEVVAIATNALGGKYYMTAHSYDGGKIRATNGFNTADCEDYKAPAPKPTPKPEPKPEPVPPKPGGPKVKYSRYDKPVKTEVLKADTKLWDFNYNTWGEIAAHPIDTFAKGHEIDIVGQAEHPLGGVYLMTSFSFGNADEDGSPHKTWGINAVDVKQVAELPAPEPQPEPEEPEPVPELPDDGGPSTAGPGDLLEPEPNETVLSWFERFWQSALGKAILSVLSKFKFGG